MKLFAAAALTRHAARAALGATFLISFASVAFAQSADGRSTADIEKENAALRTKIQRLEAEKENITLRTKVDRLQGRRPVQAASPESTQGTPQPLVTRIETSSPDRTLVMADMPMKAPVAAPLRVSDWSGVYVGLEGGYGWGKQDDPNVVFPGPLFDPGDRFPNVAFQFGNSNGWLIGGFVGAQKQWGSWVFGMEADLDAANMKNFAVASATRQILVAGTGALDCTLPQTTLCLTQTVTGASKIDALGSVRGKVGLAPTPNLLIYGTGGLGFAHVQNDVTLAGTFNGAPVNGSTFSVVTAGGTSMLGWAAGAGFDWKWNTDAGSAWVFGVEYLHYDFGRHTITVSDNAGASSAFHSSVSADAVKGRISYMFSIH